MNSKTPQQASAGRTVHRAPALVLLTLALSPAGAALADAYQQNALFAPSTAQLNAEARGLVMIYDGLDVGTVDRALDQFSRIDSMMFVRTRYPVEDGEDYLEEDDCD